MNEHRDCPYNYLVAQEGLRDHEDQCKLLVVKQYEFEDRFTRLSLDHDKYYLVRLDSHLIANIESKLYTYLENLPSYSSLYTNRLDAELAEDQRIIKKINENL